MEVYFVCISAQTRRARIYIFSNESGIIIKIKKIKI